MDFPSRSDKREVLLYSKAEKGSFSFADRLYLGEIKKLKQLGFYVSIESIFDSDRKLYNAVISWENAYNNSIPHLVYAYTTKTIDTFPHSQISSFAQELYVIAKRASNS